MSDNWQNDDLPWLDKTPDQPKNDPNRLGVTGQLPWRQLPDEDNPSSQSDDGVAQVDWGSGANNPARTDADPTKGLTGNLPWNATASDPSDKPTGTGELINWLDADDKRRTSEAEAFQDNAPTEEAPANELPDWLNDATEASAPSEAGQFSVWGEDARSESLESGVAASVEDVPDWLMGFAEDDSPAASDAGYETPTPEATEWGDFAPSDDSMSWFEDNAQGQSVDELFAAPTSAEDGFELPDWLDDNSEPEPSSNQQSIDELFAAPASTEEEFELPDWLNDSSEAETSFDQQPIEETVSAPASAEDDFELPDWLMGIDDEPAADELDFNTLVPSAQPSIARLPTVEPAPDDLNWLAETEIESEQPASGDAFDWFSTLADSPPAKIAPAPIAPPPVAQSSSDDPFAWLTEATAKPESSPVASAPETDKPAWMLSDGSEFATKAYSANDIANLAAEADDLNWLDQTPETETASASSELTYEEWARQNQVEESFEAEEPASDLNWLTETPDESSFETYEEPASNLTYAEWENRQSEAEHRVQNPEIPLPDFDLPDLGETAPADLAGGDYVPEWFMGVEELDDSNVPDWVKASMGKPTGSLPPALPIEDFDLPPLDLDLPLPNTGELGGLDFLGADLELPPLDELPLLDIEPPALPETGSIRRLEAAPPTSTGSAVVLDNLFDDELAATPVEASFDDLFGDVVVPSTAPAEASFDDLFGDALPALEMPQMDDLADLPTTGELAGLSLGGEDDAPDWLKDYDSASEQPVEELDLPFELPEVEVDPTAIPDWFEDLEFAAPAEPEPLPIRNIAEPLPPAEPPITGDLLADLDAILATSAVPDSSPQLMIGGLDTADDVRFDDDFLNSFQNIPATPSQAAVEIPLDLLEGEDDDYPLETLEQEDLPEWMRQIHTQGDQVAISVAGVEGYFEQVSEVVLSPDLRELREEALSYTAQNTSQEKALESGPLAGVAGALGITPALVTVDNLRAYRVYTPPADQQARLENLQRVLEVVQEEESLDADGRVQLELTGEDQAAVENDLSAAATRKYRHVRVKRDRLAITAIILVAIFLPFLTTMFQWADPPDTVLDEDAQPLAFAIDSLETRSADESRVVLVAFEYGAAAAYELDPLAEAALRDILAHGGLPVIVSTNPIGILHAQKVLTNVVQDELLLAAVPNPRYVILRYLSGGAVAVRTLLTTETFNATYFAHDISGQETGLEGIGRLEATDLAMVVVIGEGYDDSRIWAEQLQNLTVPKFALVTAAAEPMTLPYLTTGGYNGVLSGLQDALTYDNVRNVTVKTPAAEGSLPNPHTAHPQSAALGAMVTVIIISLGSLMALLKLLRQRRSARK